MRVPTVARHGKLATASTLREDEIAIEGSHPGLACR